MNKCRKEKNISLEQIAVHYGLEITKTKMKKKLDGEMTKEVKQDE